MVDEIPGATLDDEAALWLYENPGDDERAVISLLGSLPLLPMPDDIIASLRLALATASSDAIIDLRPIDLRADAGESEIEPALIRRESREDELD